VIRALFAALLLLATFTPTALANGAPIKIPLTRLPAVVNFGKPDGVGEAQITAVEGDVSLTVQGLERLTNELYQGWLVNSKTGERLPVAKFNVTADGAAKNQSIVVLGNREYDLFVVTVEPEPDPSPSPDERIVLAGYWPGREPPSPAAATVTAAANRGPGQVQGTVPAGATILSTQLPTGLPRTGDGFGFQSLAIILGVLGIGAAAFVRRSER
jgi:hypothetical protein